MTDSEELAELKRLLFKDKLWIAKCEIIPDYMPPFPQGLTRPMVVVRYNNGGEYPPFLRYSRGPLQGYFWDIYGDDFQSVALATVALSRAPPPHNVDPIRFSIPLRNTLSAKARYEGKGIDPKTIGSGG